LAIRGGYKSARNSAIGCAILLAVIEGVGIGLGRLLTPPPPTQQQAYPSDSGAQQSMA